MTKIIDPRMPRDFTSDMSAFTPPPAKQASGEFDSWWAALGVNAATSVTPYVIARRAWDAALSQRPVVDEAMVERAMDALAAEEAHVFGERKTPNNGARGRCMRAALTAALAPQQPEKGEG